MPQDNMRSVVYRSFVTCNDPKGVVECGTIRKSKSSLQKMEGKLENQKMPKKLNRSLSQGEGKKELVSDGVIRESYGPSTFQIMEVSRGAQKLNQVIDSWSKGNSLKGQSKDIAKDLLKGALDLQESLVMLSKLQEASQNMTTLKRKQKGKDGVGKADEVGVERTSSDRFGNPNYQNPRLSADGSSRDCYEELREVIRDSLARQNLLPHKSCEEKAYFDRSKRGLYADIPSTSSSSRSSMTYSHDFASSESSLSTKILEEKPKGSNVIAKLMGLEEFPSKPLQLVSRNQLERGNILNQGKLIFDIDIRKERKPQVVIQKGERKSMTLQEIMDNMHFKGLLKRNQHDIYQSNTSYMETKFSNNAAPIVLMKPTRPDVEEEPFPHNFISKEEDLHFEDKRRIWRTKEEIPPKIMEYPKGVLKSNESSRNLHFEETVKKLSQEKAAKTRKKVLPKIEGKEVSIEAKLSSNKMNASVHVNSTPQKEGLEKIVDSVHHTKSRKKPAERESVKSTSVPTFHKPSNASLTKLRKSETVSNNVNKKCITRHKSSTSNSITKSTQPAISHSESVQKRSVKHPKLIKESLSTNVLDIVSKDDDKQIDLSNESDVMITKTTPALQLITEEGTDMSEIVIKEYCDHDLNSLCEETSLPTEHESNSKCGEATDCSNLGLEKDNLCETRTTAEDSHDAVPRTAQCLSQIEEPFDNLDAYQPLALQVLASFHDDGLANPKLFSDYANELLEIRSQRHIPYPLLHRPVDDSRFCISTEHLMEEARNGIENLRSYSKLSGKSIASDTVSALLERDLWCKGLVAGTWGMGWREGFTSDDIHLIVSDMDKIIFHELIEEVLADFLS